MVGSSSNDGADHRGVDHSVAGNQPENANAHESGHSSLYRTAGIETLAAFGIVAGAALLLWIALGCH